MSASVIVTMLVAVNGPLRALLAVTNVGHGVTQIAIEIGEYTGAGALANCSRGSPDVIIVAGGIDKSVIGIGQAVPPTGDGTAGGDQVGKGHADGVGCSTGNPTLPSHERHSGHLTSCDRKRLFYGSLCHFDGATGSSQHGQPNRDGGA